MAGSGASPLARLSDWPPSSASPYRSSRLGAPTAAGTRRPDSPVWPAEPVSRREASTYRPGSGNGRTEPALAEVSSATNLAVRFLPLTVRGMTGRSSRGGCCIDMQSSRWCIGCDRAANDARPRWINARRPAVRRSSSGLHDALAECSRSDIMGGCCATYCCATPFGTSVLSPRQDVVR